MVEGYRRLVDLSDIQVISTVLNSFRSQEAGTDLGDYVLLSGVRGLATVPLSARSSIALGRLIVKCNDDVRRFETNWTFRSYSVSQLKSLLHSVRELEHVGTYDFGHCIECPIPFDGTQLDTVFILRRR